MTAIAGSKTRRKADVIRRRRRRFARIWYAVPTAFLIGSVFVWACPSNAGSAVGAITAAQATVASDHSRADRARMTGARLIEMIKEIDPNASARGNSCEFVVEDRTLTLVFDEAAGRMRVFTPIVEVDEVSPATLYRMSQANFDSALDVRYAAAHSAIWSVFVHPLATLDEHDFIAALGQVYVAADTFGTTFSSGTFAFGGGDSSQEYRSLVDRIESRVRPTI